MTEKREAAGVHPVRSVTGFDWKPVVNALLGTWPSQVNAWGPEVLAAYVSELHARGLTPDSALMAIRSFDPGADFPPSAAKLAQQARNDPSRPTPAEALTLLYGRGGVFRARPAYKQGGWRGDELAKATDRLQLDRALELHPLLRAFVEAQGIDRLRALEIDSPDYGELNRRRLGEDWERFCEANETRSVAALVSGRRGEMARLDPLSAIRRGDQTGLPAGDPA